MITQPSSIQSFVRKAASLSLLLTFCILPMSAVHAQSYDLYATLWKSRGYVVGAKLSDSGLHLLNVGVKQDTTWTQIGWNNPRINGVDYDPSNPQTLYLSAGNGVMKSTNRGRTWRTTSSWDVTEAQEISVDQKNPNNLFVATAAGIWRSTDRGESWTDASKNIAYRWRYTQSVKVDRSRSGSVLAGTDGGIYRSDTNGNAWRLVSPAVPIWDIEQSRSNPNVWIAATIGKGVIISRDGGRTWRSTNAQADGHFYSVDISPTNANQMVAVGFGTGIWASTNGGTTWRKIGQPTSTNNSYEVKFDRNSPDRFIVATTEKGIYSTNDMGQTWKRLGMNGALVFDMAFIPKQ